MPILDFLWTLALAHVCGAAVLAPMWLKPVAPQAKVQFRVTEFYGLTVEMFAAAWLFAWPLIDRNAHTPLFIGLLIIWTLLAIWWLIGLRLLARNRTADSSRRLITLCVLIPAAFGGSWVMLLNLKWQYLNRRGGVDYLDIGVDAHAVFWWYPLWLFLFTPYGQLFLLLLVFLCCPRIARWVVIRADAPQPPPPHP
ncbi:MAG: hypothetical protein AMXMBFR7_10590 [Planctomycetota bacterium]